MLINRIISVDEEFDSGEVTEPVTLQEVKNYMRLGGFTDTDDSGEQDIDFDDSLIESLITEARMWLEKFTGQYIVPRSLTIVLLNQAGGIKLPGPVSGAITFVNSEAVAVTDLRVNGALYPRINTPYGCSVSSPYDQLTATYEVGTTEFPAWVENAIMAFVAWSFEQRGDEQGGSPERAAAIARPHRRVVQWG